MRPFQLLGCAFGRHHRDHRKITLVGGLYHAPCSGCGVALVKVARAWKVRSRENARPS